MATIITVHGTGATGPEHGERWWQKGSPFEAHIRQLVEGEDGDLKYEPLIWDGANSETSRRIAGRRLLDRCAELEQRRETYSVVGHSHGGSVIAAALFMAAMRRRRLPHLSTWITIGTPFLVVKKRRFLFNRINFWEKSAYVLVLTSGLLFTIAMFVMPQPWQIIGQFRIERAHIFFVVFLIALLIFFFPAFLVLFALSLFSSRRCYSGKKRCARRFDQYFVGRWHSFFHRDDEAIGGLHLTTKIEFPIFRRLFLLPQLSLLALILLPVALLLVITSETAALTMFDFLNRHGATLPLFVDNGQLKGQGKDIAANAMAVVTIPLAIAHKLGLGWMPDFFLTVLPTYFGSSINPNIAVLLTALPFFLFYALMFYVPALLVVLTATTIGAFASLGLSRVLDGLTWRQLRASAFGDDHLAEAVVGTGVRPMWSTGGMSSLPEALGEEISAFSDQQASRSVARLRSAVHVLAFAEGGREKSDLLSTYLTWDELIHTSYFQVPRFCKLVAYALSTADGFRATAALRADSDHELVAGWFEELQRTTEFRGPDAAVAPVDAATGPQSMGYIRGPIQPATG